MLWESLMMYLLWLFVFALSSLCADASKMVRTASTAIYFDINATTFAEIFESSSLEDFVYEDFKKELLECSQHVPMYKSAYTSVYSGTLRVDLSSSSKGNKVPVAIKSVIDHNSDFFVTEAKLLKLLNHEHIIKAMYVISETKSHVAIFFDLHRKGSLGRFSFYHCNPRNVSSEKAILGLFRQLMSALSYLHKLKVAHRDVKPPNMLLSETNGLLLIDFGSASKPSEPVGRPHSFTLVYAAPEMCDSSLQLDYSLDIYSSGLSFMSFFGHPMPRIEAPGACTYNEIQKGVFDGDILKVQPGEFRDLLKRCTSLNPKDRPTASQVLESPILAPNNETDDAAVLDLIKRLPNAL